MSRSFKKILSAVTATVLLGSTMVLPSVTSAEPFPASGRCARGALAHEIEKGVVIIVRTCELLAFQYLAAFSLSCEHSDVQGVGGDEPQWKIMGFIQSPVNIEYYSLYVIHEV